FFPSYSWIPGILFLLSLGLGWMKFKETGHRIEKDRIYLSNWGTLTRRQTVFYKRRVQSYAKKQHKLQQIECLATVHFSVIGVQSQAVIQHVNDEDANLMGDWHSRRRSEASDVT